MTYVSILIWNSTWFDKRKWILLIIFQKLVSKKWLRNFSR